MPSRLIANNEKKTFEGKKGVVCFSWMGEGERKEGRGRG